MKKKKKNSSTPRHKRMKRAARLQAARAWVPKYGGLNIVKGYSKHFAVDKLCAVKELEMIGFTIDPDYVKQLKVTLEEGLKARERRKLQKEQERELNIDNDSNDTFYYIAGYTPGEAPYGITWEEMNLESYSDEPEEAIKYDIEDDIEDEDYDIPF